VLIRVLVLNPNANIVHYASPSGLLFKHWDKKGLKMMLFII